MAELWYISTEDGVLLGEGPTLVAAITEAAMRFPGIGDGMKVTIVRMEEGQRERN